MMKRTNLGGLLVVLLSMSACGGASVATRSASSGPVRPAVSATALATCAGPSAAAPLAPAFASSALALAKVQGKPVAFVADEDAKAILTIDLESHKQLAETPLDGTPAQVWVAPDGRVLATLRDKSELVALSASRADAPLARLCGVPTPAEPIAIAATPAGLVVTSGWGQKLTGFDARTLARRFDVKLPREPRSVVVSDDGKTAFVSHSVGSVITAVDLEGPRHEATPIGLKAMDANELRVSREQDRVTAKATKKSLGPADQPVESTKKARTSCQGFALAKSEAIGGRIFAPAVFVDPGNFDERPDGYGSEDAPTEIPAVAVIDETARTTLAASTVLGNDQLDVGRRGAREGQSECLLPRAAVVDAKTKSLLVTCFGIDAVIAYDAAAANPLLAERRRWVVGAGPSGVAVDPETHRAIVWSQFDRTLASFPIGGSELADDKVTAATVKKTPAGPLREALPSEYVLGRILFHAAGDRRIAADGRACASCHPDGRDDAITWATPEGPRRSIMLAGRAPTTAPYSWTGDEASLHGHLGNTFERLSGAGVRSIELDALIAYIAKMPAPPRERPADAAQIERGRAIFASNATGCASCHSGATFSDGKNHDVGSKHKADRSSAFNTPSLHLVGGTGPYFHDGRYATLTELLTKTDGTMGHTKHLTHADLDALEAYLRTL